ncbi:MetQ/NlpA family ABC transporter substrate-binding protein [Aerococcus sanguinicola]
MSEIKEAQAREAMDPAYQWDLSSIYAQDEDFEKDLANFSQHLDRLAPYQGQLHKGEDQVIGALEVLLEISRQLERLYVYAHLKHDQDTTNAKYLDYNNKASGLLTEVSSALSWLDKGVDLDVQVFTDYVQPNKALADGSLDLNAFQHMAFLHDFNSSEQQDLQPVGYTYISAMAAYSDKVESLDDLKDGAEIAIPNDATNGGRALLLLELAGVIEIDDNAGISPTPNDITENPKNVKITELDAAQVPRSLGDADAVVANTNYAVDAGLNPFKDGIFVDTEDLAKVGTQYKCIIATQKDRANDEAIKKVVETYQTPETEAKIKEVTDGADQKAWSDNDNISADYKALDEQVKAAKKK